MNSRLKHIAVRIHILCALLLLTAVTSWAQSAGTKPIYPIKFKSGMKTTVVKGQVSPPVGEGDMYDSGREKYSLQVRAGQYLTIRISSDNHHAMFTLIKPSPGGSKFEVVEKASAVKRWSGRLTMTGNYLVTVFTQERKAGSRFKLRITLR